MKQCIFPTSSSESALSLQFFFLKCKSKLPRCTVFSCAFVDSFPRSSRDPAETYFHPECHFTPKNAEFRARACFHP